MAIAYPPCSASPLWTPRCRSGCRRLSDESYRRFSELARGIRRTRFQPQPLFIGILRIRARWVNTCDHVSEGLVTIGAEAGFGRLPDAGRDLCSQPTASRREREVAELSLAGCGKSRDFGETVMKRARNGNPGLIKSTGYEGAKGDESGWKHHRPTFSAAC